MFFDNEEELKKLEYEIFFHRNKIDSKYQYVGKYGPHNVPRVTEILSIINDEYITQWANNLGRRGKDYNTELDFYANIGTIVHELCDQILLGNDIDLSVYPREIVNQIYNCTSACKNWWNELNNMYEEVEVVFLEKELISPCFGGTCDMLLKINGKYILGDFKTSNHIGYKYWCQLAAYVYILEQQGYHIDGVFILQLNKNRPLYKVYSMPYLDDVYYDDCYNDLTISYAFELFIFALKSYITRIKLLYYMDYNDYNERYIPWIYPAEIIVPYNPQERPIYPAFIRKKEELAK